jgi:hypothetical protein
MSSLAPLERSAVDVVAVGKLDSSQRRFAGGYNKIITLRGFLEISVDILDR